MNNSSPKEGLENYLLGKLSNDDDQLLDIEEKLFHDSKFFEELLIAEDILVDKYIENELFSDDKELFENLLLFSPLHREKTNLVRHLKDIASENDIFQKTSLKENRINFTSLTLWHKFRGVLRDYINIRYELVSSK